MERWQRGEISTMEEIENIFATFNASRVDMESFLRTVQLDPGFKPLQALCRQWDTPIAIVSDGLRWYIDYILDFHGVEGVEVFAAEVAFASGGFQFEYPWYDPAFPLRATAKPLIVEEYQLKGYEVIFVGDGLTDVEAAQVADVVYAKDVLLLEMRARGLEARQYVDLHDVVRDM
jgi:2-hydroxy-3-keto-5-methylthiopentenyl-1-phosphate phosphatase